MQNIVKLAVIASIALIIGLAAAMAIAFNPLDRSPALSESELEAIARAWAADGVNGAAGDEMVEFIVANTTVNSPELLRQYLKPRLDSGATWTYGPFASAGGDSYEAFATATLHTSDIMPATVSYQPKASGESAFVDPGEFRNVFTLTFRLTVDAASESVTDWRAQDGQAIYAPDAVATIS